MKGLLTKDWIILRNQWKTALMIFLTGIAIAATQEPWTMIGYLPFLATMLVLGTFSYDEIDNSYSYLFTLPASRSTYVKEKYLFSVLVILLATAISILSCVVMLRLSAASQSIDWYEMLFTAATVFALVMLLLAVEIPLRLKYGVEKGRLPLYALFGIAALAAILASRFVSSARLESIGNFLISRGFAVPGVTVLVSLLLLFLSYRLSNRILAAKEF